MTSQATTATSGTLSQAIHVPVVSVNLSMTRTVLIRPGDGAAIPVPSKLNGGGIPPPFRCCASYFFFASGLSATALPPPSGQ